MAAVSEQQEPTVEPRFAIRPVLTRTQIMKQRLYVAVFVKPLDFMEVGLGLFMVVRGIWLLLPFETFDTSPGYAAMDEIARLVTRGTVDSEIVWGLALLWIGATQVGSYALAQWRTRLASTLGACVCWAFMAIMVAVSNFYGGGWLVWGAFSIGSGWMFGRVLTARDDDE